MSRARPADSLLISAAVAALTFACGAAAPTPTSVAPAPSPPVAAARVEPSRQPQGGYAPGLSAAQARPVMLRSEMLVRGCHTVELGEGTDKLGEIELEWRVEPSGKVSEVSVTRDTFGHPRFTKCAVQAIRTLEFPIAEGPTLVARLYPFRSTADSAVARAR